MSVRRAPLFDAIVPPAGRAIPRRRHGSGTVSRLSDMGDRVPQVLYANPGSGAM